MELTLPRIRVTTETLNLTLVTAVEVQTQTRAGQISGLQAMGVTTPGQAQ
jgi:hypothetical protein